MKNKKEIKKTNKSTLSWLEKKGIKKEREIRYENTNGLQSDLRNY